MKKRTNDQPETLARGPYVGPRPFERGEPLFGRDQEKQELASLLRSRRVVLMYSPSGAGKTSLIQAGLLPLMKTEGLEILPVIRVNKDLPKDLPLSKLGPPLNKGAAPAATQVNRFVFSVLASLDEKAPLDHLLQLSARPDGLGAYLAERSEQSKGKPARRLLVFDQFEEILTTDPVDSAAKHRFLEVLMPVLSDPRNLLLFSMREDFIAGLDPYLIYFPERLSVRFRLELLGRTAALKAVQEPAKRQNVEFVDDAAKELVSRLSKVNVFEGGEVSEIDSPFVEPVHLQVVCERLWSAPKGDSHKITLVDLDAIGSVEKALGKFYDEKVAEVARTTGKPELNLREWIERRLITPQKVRNQAMAGQEKEFGLDAATIHELTRVFLVRKDERRSTLWYELAHDRLIAPILQANTEWRSANKLFYRTPEELGTKLEETGWGLLLAGNADPAPILQALQPLLKLRKAQVGPKNAKRYHEFVFEQGYRPGETAQDWLARQNAGLGQYNPEWVPSYLLLVGSPEEIPFEFQYGLDVQYAVGRIHFETIAEYATYARSVALCESGSLRLPNRAAIFAPQHPGDSATRMSVESLAKPLVKRLAEARPNWNIQGVLQEQATKANLAGLLGGQNTPSVLLTLSHAMRLPPDNEARQRDQTGAPLCQDWGGAGTGQPVGPEHIFAAGDLSPEARVLGMVAFMWGSYTAGLPREDREGAIREKAQAIRAQGVRTPLLPKQQAPVSFLSRLPQRLLSHPLGGALAVIGITWLGWNYAFSSSEELGTNTIFDFTLQRLMEGYTVGRAMNLINQRAAMFASRLDETLQEYAFGNQALSDQFPRQVVEYYDARDFILIGDPAARLPVEPSLSYVPPAEDWQWPVLPALQVAEPVSSVLENAPANLGLPLSKKEPDAGAALESLQPPPPPPPPRQQTQWQTQRPSQDDVENWYINGIDALSGQPWLPPLKVAEMAEAILQEEIDRRLLNELNAQVEVRVSYNVTSELVPTRLEDTGWGVILPPGGKPERLQGLEPLFEMRKEQAQGRYKELQYHPGETSRDFLLRHGVGPGPLQPEQLPYYLLLAGSPEEIPFSIQTDLSRRYAVGRLHFDQPESYGQYAMKVKTAEELSKFGKFLPGVGLFSPRSPEDPVSEALYAQLAQPLVEDLAAQQEALETWVHFSGGENAGKTRLAELLAKERPGLLFLAGQGLVYPRPQPELRARQGGLICQDWPGPQQWTGPLMENFVFGGMDYPLNPQQSGGFVIQVNSCSLGFPGLSPQDRLFPQILDALPAVPPFISALPQQMLGAIGGPLGVIGMLGHAWSPGPGARPRALEAKLQSWEVFRDALVELINGAPAGHALRLFQQYFAMTYVQTAVALEDIQYGKREDPLSLVSLWAARNDFGSLALLGDPAARLTFERGERRRQFKASKINVSSAY